jgi:hypothetical protein
MSEQDDLIPVGIEEGLTVYLSPRLRWAHVRAIKLELAVEKERVGGTLTVGEIIGLLSEGYILYGIAAWNLKDADGKEIPVTHETVRAEILGDEERAAIVGDRADDLYSQQVLIPLLSAGAKSSAITSTNGSTLATTGSSAKPLKRSRRSSTSTSPTAVIEKTSSPPAGDSSS